MALNPKLNIFVVGLNPRDKEASPTYRDYFKSKYFGNANTSDRQLLESFFKDFLNTVGKADFRKDDKSKKVIGVSEYDAQNEKTSISLKLEKHVIHGLIDGGQYGVKRAYANLDNKKEKKKYVVKGTISTIKSIVSYQPTKIIEQSSEERQLTDESD